MVRMTQPSFGIEPVKCIYCGEPVEITEMQGNRETGFYHKNCHITTNLDRFENSNPEIKGYK